MRIPTPQLIGLVALAAIWGASFMLIKVMLEEMGPVAVAWVRLGGGAALVLAVAAWRRPGLPRSARHWFDVCVVALLASAIPLVLIPWGEQEISSQLAGILNGAMPLWVALFAHAFLASERLHRTATLGLVLGFAGTAVVIGPDVLDMATASTQGALAVVVATVGYGASAVYVRPRLLGVDSTLLAGSQNVIAFAMLTPLLLAVESVPDLPSMSSRVVIASIGLALLSSGVAYIIYYWLLATLHATQAALVTYLIPIAAVFWGWVVLSESIGFAALPGLLLIVLGIYLVNRPARVEAGARPSTEVAASVARMEPAAGSTTASGRTTPARGRSRFRAG